MTDASSPRRSTRPPAPGSRRRLRAAIILLLFAAAVTGAAIAGWRIARESPPHKGPIVLISIDSLRADHLPIYGYTRVATPNIDALAADGVVFERAYAHSPQTLPSHASLLTGRLPFEHGVRDNVGDRVQPGERTMARLLRGRGFSTGAAVSSWLLRKEAGLNLGFQFFDAEFTAAAPGASPEPAPALGPAPATPMRRNGAQTVAAATAWMAGLRGDPRFFLFVHLYDLHRPYAPPDRYAKLPPYDAEVTYDDELVGRVIGFIRERGWYDRATIIVVADHGEGLGNHGEQEHGLLLYDEAIRVPLVVKLPDQVSAGRRVADPVQHIDLVPTVLDFVRAPAPGGLRGRSLRPVLESAKARLVSRPVYAESLFARRQFGWSDLHSLTDGRFHYIRGSREELFDLDADPLERTSVLDSRPQATAVMRAVLDKLTTDQGIAPPPDAVSDEDRERFAALGYLGTPPPAPGVDASPLPDPRDKVASVEAYRGAMERSSRGDVPGAIAGLRAIVAANPEMTEVWNRLGVMLTGTGRLDEALAAYRAITELRPDAPAGYLSAAATLLRLHRLDEARTTADLAVQHAQGDVRATVEGEGLLARIALAAKAPEAAQLHASRAAEADPTMPLLPLVEGRLLYDQGKFEDALTKFEAGLAMLEGRPVTVRDLHLFAGETLARLDRYAEAEQHFHQELRACPTNLRAYVSLATLYNAQGRKTDAAAAVDALMRIAPTPEGYGMAVRMLAVMGDRAGADRLRADARRKFKGDPSIKLLDVPQVGD